MRKQLRIVMIAGFVLSILTACGSVDEVKKIELSNASVQIHADEPDDETGTTKETETVSQNTGSEKEKDPKETEKAETEPDTTDAAATVAAPNSVINPDKGAGTFESGDCSITISGIKLSVGTDFLPYVDTIGKAKIVQGEACLGGGYDTNYYYGDSLAVYTYAEDGKQIIYDIYITGSEYPTDKGAKTGSTTREDLYRMYGEASESFQTTERYRINGSDTVVSFVFAADVLESIDILDGGVQR